VKDLPILAQSCFR